MINPPTRPLALNELFQTPVAASKGMLVPSAPSQGQDQKRPTTGFFVLTGITIIIVAVAVYQYEQGRKEERMYWQQKLDFMQQIEQHQHN